MNGHAMPASPTLNAVSPLRTRSMPEPARERTAPMISSRPQSAPLCSQQAYALLLEHAVWEPVTDHREVEEMRTRKWEQAEQSVTSAFFKVWAVAIVLLGGWHVATQLSASVTHLQVAGAVLAASCTQVAFSRMNRQALVA
ncbi:hypothetical protein T484DRAFT_1989508, partial [Baffinella frigidus]